MVRLWQELPAARLGGLAHDTGPPDQQAMVVALVRRPCDRLRRWSGRRSASGPRSWPFSLPVAAAYIFTRLSYGAIGGRTGDTLGACQQIAVIAFLVGVAAALKERL